MLFVNLRNIAEWEKNLSASRFRIIFQVTILFTSKKLALDRIYLELKGFWPMMYLCRVSVQSLQDATALFFVQ